MNAPVTILSLPLQLPRRTILARLGFHAGITTLSAPEVAQLDEHLTAAFRLCHPAGTYRILAIQQRSTTSVTLEDGWEIHCPSVAKMLHDASHVWVAAATIGHHLKPLVDQATANGDLATAAIYDAVGSECADAAMDALQDLSRQQLRPRGLSLAKCRFSPGFGGWPLDAQQAFQQRLPFQQLGLSLTDSFFLIPEKSVTAIAPLS